jgi:hypothetical protein
MFSIIVGWLFWYPINPNIAPATINTTATTFFISMTRVPHIFSRVMIIISGSFHPAGVTGG